MNILLPVDGSAAALDAVHFAIRLVREGLQASFVLANVQEPTHFYELVLTRDPEVVASAAEAAGVHALQEAQGLMHAASLVFETEVGHGDPAHTLVDIAERFGCDAVIMSSRGLGSLRSALLGSVAQSVLHASPVPVTIVNRAAEATAETSVEEVPETSE